MQDQTLTTDKAAAAEAFPNPAELWAHAEQLQEAADRGEADQHAADLAVMRAQLHEPRPYPQEA